MMKCLRKSLSLKAALSGIPSTEVLNATLTAYRYLIDPIEDMKQNLLPTGTCIVDTEFVDELTYWCDMIWQCNGNKSMRSWGNY